MWFEDLMGFEEESHEQVQSLIHVDGSTMISRVNGRVVSCGRLEVPSLAELRDRVEKSNPERGSLVVREEAGDVRDYHTNPAFAGALFQVASQFNLLEMVSDRVTPERGVGIYDYDATQGPACAISAGAATIYRNYFVPLGDQRGQTAEHQIDCVQGLGESLGNQDQQLWTMRNGYLLPSDSGMAAIQQQLEAASPEKMNALRDQVCIGLHWNVEVTRDSAGHVVSQAFCSALPLAYTHLDDAEAEGLCRLILEAAYEATMWAALLPDRMGPSRKLVLTLIGGGAFGNRGEWIADAIARALTLIQERGFALDVTILQYGGLHPVISERTASF